MPVPSPRCRTAISSLLPPHLIIMRHWKYYQARKIVSVLLRISVVASALSLSVTPVIAQTSFDPAKLTDKDMCTIITGAAEQANARMPYSPDRLTTATGIAVDCTKRRYETSYRVATIRANASAEWQANTQSTLTQAVCSGLLMGAMARRGWQFASKYAFSDGQSLVFTVSCRN